MEVLQPSPTASVLDLGVTSDELYPESNFFEKWYPHRNMIMAAGVEDVWHLGKTYPGVRFVRIAGLGRLPFKDDEFDILFCNAVLEHVGGRPQQKEFLSEVFRVSKRFFLATPNRWFPVESHTHLPLVHYLPTSIHRAVLRTLGYDYYSREENLSLLSKRLLRALFPCPEHVHMRNVRIFGSVSNLIAYGISAYQRFGATESRSGS
jgi:SAM-dependent methyltransferase